MDVEDATGDFPNIFEMFQFWGQLYFHGSLGACSVHWSSSRMTLCAGVCEFSRHGGCRIKLSEPLLKFRPAKDLKETLLHEMIHAYIFLNRIRDDGDHGTQFCKMMRAINASAAPDPYRPPGGYNITVYHTMHAEVDSYRQHHWRCKNCGHLVKRAMNREPQEADCSGRRGQRGDSCRDPRCSYHMHKRHCGGQFEKIKEPEGYKDKRRKGQKGGQKGAADGAGGAPGSAAGGRSRGDVQPFEGQGRVLGAGKIPPAAAAGTKSITAYFSPTKAAPAAAQVAGARESDGAIVLSDSDSGGSARGAGRRAGPSTRGASAVIVLSDSEGGEGGGVGEWQPVAGSGTPCTPPVARAARSREREGSDAAAGRVEGEAAAKRRRLAEAAERRARAAGAGPR